MDHVIDLRSDTVTTPCDRMRAAMSNAKVGDDDYEEDPTARRLQETAAHLFGFESALFVSSGTQGNLVALLTHCARGDEYITGQEAHIYKFEGGGAATLGGIQPQPLPHQSDGTILLSDVLAAIKPKGKHCARTRLIAVENTFGGRVLPPSYTEAVTAAAAEHALATHLDGARILNAAVKLTMPAAAMVRGFDSLSFCLSKGLGAPAGSVLCGSQAFIAEAVRWRKMLGGGMRQIGVLAAAGLYALKNNVDRLAEDHENAHALARGLDQVEQLRVKMPDTNILYVDVPPHSCGELARFLERHGVRARIAPRTRLVTHKDVSRSDVQATVELVKSYFLREQHGKAPQPEAAAREPS